MNQAPRTPVAHLAVLAGLAVAFLIGGRITFEAWGTVAVRPLVAYATLATVVHAASRWTDEHALAVRSVAWLVLASMPLHLTTLLRPEVMVPLVALGVTDLVQHRAELDMPDRVPAGAGGKAVAAMATLALLAILVVLVPLATTPGVLVRLGLVAAIGWGLVTLYALRPATRTPGVLLAGAGTFALTFALLAGPVVPLGPLATYWATIAAVTAAVLTATVAGSDDALREEHRIHEQTVRSLPDPTLVPLADRVREVVVGSADTTAFSRRLEAALDREAGGRLLDARARELVDAGVPEPIARQRALADLLDVDLQEAGRP